MPKILIVAEHLNGKLNSSTARCVTCARQIGAEAIDVLVLADTPDAIAAEAAKIEGVSRVLTAANPANAHALAAVYAPQVVAAASGYSHVLAPSTTFGKDLMPRVAARPAASNSASAAKARTAPSSSGWKCAAVRSSRRRIRPAARSRWFR